MTTKTIYFTKLTQQTMKKRLFSSLLLGMCALGLYAQPAVTVLSDVTSKLTNADFSMGTPVTATIYTYDYNMEDEGLGAGGSSLFGQQNVVGWTGNAESDNIKVMQSSSDTDRGDGTNARAAGLFAYRSQDSFEDGPGLGGAYYPPYAVEAEGILGNALGMVAVWGADIQYAQDVTLPAGGYMMIAKVQNVAGNSLARNNNGFVFGETAFRSSKLTFPLNEWENDTIFFRLTEETAGQILVGCNFGGGSGSAPHLFIDNVALYTIDEHYFVQLEIDAAKENLAELIKIGEEYGVDTSASQRVYDDPNATLEDVQAAIENQKALNEAGTTDLSEFFIKNPHFSLDEPIEGGICTYDYDCEKNNISTSNYSLTPVKGWTPNTTTNGRAGGIFAVGGDAFLGGVDYKAPATLSDGNAEGRVLGIVTCWSQTAAYTQNVTLPVGRYLVGISYYNTGGAQAVAKNLIGFVAEDGTEYLGETTQFPVGKWTSETISFELDEETRGYFSLGYQSTNTGSGNMPHLFVDGFSLVYIGSGIDASMFALRAAVASAVNALEGNDVFNEELREALQEAYEAGQDLVDQGSDDEEAKVAATDAITSLMEKVNESIAAYKALNEFRNDVLLPATMKYDEKTYPELNEALSTMLDNVDEAREDGTWTTEEINETIASFSTIVKEGVQKAWDAAVASGEVLDNDLDISILFDQLAYTYSTTAVQGANVPDKEWQYGSATNFKTQYGTAEVWNQSPFKVSRTISDLPAGKYTITTKAFFRTADNTTNFAEYDATNTPAAYVFAGPVRTGLTNVAELASTDLSELPGAATVADDLYVPNSQQGAYEIFNNPEYTEQIEKSASTVLVSAGDLTFGVGADEMQSNSWVIWYSFSIGYNAPSDDALRDVLANLSDQAKDLQSDINVAAVAKADEKLNEAQAGYENVESLTTDGMKSLISQFEEAIAYAKESISLISELVETYTLYNEYLMQDQNHPIQSEEPVYNELIGDAGNAIISGEYESNEQIQGWIDGMKNGWTAFVQFPVLVTASVTNPGDITPVIANYTFVDPVNNENSANGWTREFAGGKEDKSDGVWEFYDNDSFKISQTIEGLAEGYYRVRVQSFYRAAKTQQDNADSLAVDSEYGRYAFLFAETESGARVKALKNAFQREDEDGQLDSQSIAGEGESVVTYGDVEEFYVPNSRASFAIYAESGLYWNQVDIHLAQGETLTLGLYKEQHAAGDWCPFDNFELYYLGNADAPDAIETVEASAHASAPVAIYNLAGQRVQKAVKGLYIVNGKKVLVK